jgi:hypothetical protein
LAGGGAQVKMATLEAQVEEMKATMCRVASENEGLRNRNSVLEKVLKLRDEQIAVLQEKVKVRGGPASHPCALSMPALRAASSGCPPTHLPPVMHPGCLVLPGLQPIPLLCSPAWLLQRECS